MAVNRGSGEPRTAESAEKGQGPGPNPFVGRSPALAEFLARLKRAAQSDSTVLLQGESGTGKGQAAARLHAESGRSAGPFLAASLVATSSTLLEATLFGHERGAFTDAHRSRLGLFRRGQGGTLVLEGIEHLPLETQVKLLRVLQERTVEPLGAEEAIRIDVRVVATTSTPLEGLVAAGRFRPDLFYRLAVLPLEVPPLRQRREDLPELTSEFTRAVAARVGVPERSLSPEALARLCAHPWPGNVRELENVLERVLVLATTGERSRRTIEAEELDFLGQEAGDAVSDLARAFLAQGLTLEVLARAILQQALRAHRGNVSAAARAVGLTRRAFEYRLTHNESEEPPA